MRKHWIDNLRWVTVLLVLFYHVIYFYNNKASAASAVSASIRSVPSTRMW